MRIHQAQLGDGAIRDAMLHLAVDEDIWHVADQSWRLTTDRDTDWGVATLANRATVGEKRSRGDEFVLTCLRPAAARHLGLVAVPFFQGAEDGDQGGPRGFLERFAGVRCYLIEPLDVPGPDELADLIVGSSPALDRLARPGASRLTFATNSSIRERHVACDPWWPQAARMDRVTGCDEHAPEGFSYRVRELSLRQLRAREREERER